MGKWNWWVVGGEWWVVEYLQVTAAAVVVTGNGRH